ncbi:MAG: 5-bromo-4-chloroindolyl phosphate hydrolysis family protein [Lachnospiraceae bacterium]|nr:5-bromo-4-chloroindolyl phosphate hydrolysis family protein [Lachnospiraceae bacterium]
MNQNDFDKINQRIQQTINDASDNLQRIIDNPRWSSIYGGIPNPIKRDGTRNVVRPDGSTVRTGSQTPPARPKPRLFENLSGKKTGGIISLVSGIIAAVIGLVRALGALFTMLANGPTFFYVTGFAWAVILLAGGLFLTLNGANILSRIKRFREYVSLLGKNSFIEIDKLADATGESQRFLRKDLKDMIRRKYFLQGHLDDEEENLIVSDETYQDYQNMKEQQRLRMEEAEKLDESGLDQEGRAIISQGEYYLKKIKEANDNLPGEVISAKLYELENVINRILVEVKRQPASAGDLRKLMNYYLPTTWKLLEAYQEVEKQPVKTQQMVKTQQEIEETLDTINDAFKRLLDQLFMKQAWDISTDISVLNSMLVQEGLKDGDFALKR